MVQFNVLSPEKLIKTPGTDIITLRDGSSEVTVGKYTLVSITALSPLDYLNLFTLNVCPSFRILNNLRSKEILSIVLNLPRALSYR